MSSLVLTVEDRDPVRGPSIGEIEAAVDALTPRGGPGFLILENANEDYAQVAGGDGPLTAEWRECAGGTFTHWVAGYDGPGAGENVEIETNGAVVTVQRNEVLVSEDVKTILAAFARGEGRPTQYLWRDMTASFR